MSVPSSTQSDLSHVAGVLSGAITSLAQCVQSLRLYGHDHPRTRKLLSQTEVCFRATSLDDAPLCTVVTPDSIALGEQSLGSPAQLSALAHTLRKNDIAAIEWLARPTADDLSKLAHWLADPGNDQGPQAFVTRCGSWVRPVSVAGDTLHFIDEANPSSPVTRDWRTLVSALRTTGDARLDPASAHAFDALQAALNSAPPDQSDKAAVVLQSISAAQFGTAAAAAPHRAMAAMAPAIDTVLGGLSPELRSSLLNVGVVTGGTWIADNAHRLPIGEVAGIFHALDQQSQHPSDAASMLLQKLIGLSTLSTDVRRRLETISAKWTASSTTDARRQQSALAELMTDRGVNDFCPTDYREQLASAAASPHAQVLMPTALSDLDPAQTLLRTAEIASWLLDDQPGEGLDNAGALLAIAHDAPALLAMNRRDMVVKAALHAAAVPSTASPELLDAARAARAAVASADLIDAALSRPAQDAGAIEEIRSIAVLAPHPTLLRIGHRISSGRMSPQHAVARTVAQALSAADWRQAFATPAAETDAALLRPLLDHVDPAHLEHICEQWTLSPDAVHRDFALALLDRRLSHWSLATHRVALATGVEKLQAFSLRRLLAGQDTIDREILLSLLNGTLTSRIAEGKTLIAVVVILASQGAESRARLADLLSALARGVGLSRIRACRRIVAELEPYRAELPVARALTAWRRSLAHTVGLFVEDDVTRAAA